MGPARELWVDGYRMPVCFWQGQSGRTMCAPTMCPWCPMRGRIPSARVFFGPLNCGGRVIPAPTGRPSALLPYEKSPGVLRSRGLFFVLFKFRDILQLAGQRGTEFVQGFGFDVVICLESADSFAVNAGFLTQGVGGDSTFFHCNPQFVEYNHEDITPT